MNWLDLDITVLSFEILNFELNTYWILQLFALCIFNGHMQSECLILIDVLALKQVACNKCLINL